jgi:hypothetical protein
MFKISESVKYFLLGIVVTYFLVEIKHSCWIGSSSKELLDEKIQILVRQAARWSTAADQDISPLITLLHANYGAGFLWALKSVASVDQIERATGIDAVLFEQEIVAAQDAATKKVLKICPSFGPSSSYLTKLSGEGL